MISTYAKTYFTDPIWMRAENIVYNEYLSEPEKKKVNGIFATNNRDNSLPILIDYGSGTIKAGWANSSQPDIVFRSVVSKNKDSKNVDAPVFVGNKLKDFDYAKLNYRSPFERNVIQHFGLLENVNDYIFNELAVTDTKVSHPLVITEAMCNPEYCRMNIMEQLFECYQIPSLLLGVDSLFSFYKHMGNSIADYKSQNTTCLLVSFGHTAIHIIPIVKGCILMAEAKRINVGGFNSFEILQKNLLLKYPHLKAKLTLNTIMNYAYVANSFSDQLSYYKTGCEAFENKSYINSVQFNNNVIIRDSLYKMLFEPIVIEFPYQEETVQVKDDSKRKMELRKEQAQRLKETMARRKEEKTKKKEEELKELFNLEEKSKSLSNEEIEAKLIFYGIENISDLPKRIKKLKVQLGYITQEELNVEKFNLLEIPNDQLTPEQLKQKKFQFMQKQAAETRALKKQKQQQKIEEIQKLKITNPQEYISKLHERRNHILEKMEKRKKQKLEIGQRNSRINQKRMQTLAQLGSDYMKGKNGEDLFGMNDEDWNLYRGISKDMASDEENEENKLNELDIELREMDPEFGVKNALSESNKYGLNTFDNFIELNVDLIRGHEVYFQPTIAGIDQSGVIEVINFTLKKFPEEIKRDLLANILLMGGAAKSKNLAQRMTLDLISSNPVGSFINISSVEDPLFGAWHGMRNANKNLDLSEFYITSEEYYERGSLFFKTNPFSNWMS